jgi:signal peptidase I
MIEVQMRTKIGFILIFTFGCGAGEGPDFQGSTASQDSSKSGDVLAQEGKDQEGDLIPFEKPKDGENQRIIPEQFVIPDARNLELDPLHRCLKLLGKNNPFDSEITDFKRLIAINAMGLGVSINDTEETADPQLVLIRAALNYKSKATYNLLNPNGYYCMMLGVNFESDLSVNLHCNAYLVSASVSLDLGSQSDSAMAGLGVNILSSTRLNIIRPPGVQCRL